MVDYDARAGWKASAGANWLLSMKTHFGAGALDGVIRHYTKAGAWVVDLSATPGSCPGRAWVVDIGIMVMGKTVDWLIENKRSLGLPYFHGKHGRRI